MEQALNGDLATRSDLSKSERVSLRAQARAIDEAEASRDPDKVTRANHEFLEHLVAAGLSAAGAKPVDAFDAFLATIGEPAPGVSDTPNP